MAQEHPEDVQHGKPRLCGEHDQHYVQRWNRGAGEKLIWLTEWRNEQSWQIGQQHPPKHDGEHGDLGQ